ncbi:MAG: AAA family ATPase, partial [Deltaproteobacteria bacterium]|nr:AAA family ATPase [Deltaproteobacteria bacterium]
MLLIFIDVYIQMNEINISEELGLDDISITGTDLMIIIKTLSEKRKKQVVVLVDDYDAPVIGNIGSPELALANSQILQNLYSGLKAAHACLHFVFLTGVTRIGFSWMSGCLNYLNDLTMQDNYSDICGFTSEELDSCFSEHLPAALKNL